MDIKPQIIYCSIHSDQKARFIRIKNAQLICDRCLIKDINNLVSDSKIILGQALNKQDQIIDNWPPLKDNNLLDQIEQILQQQPSTKDLLQRLEQDYQNLKDKFTLQIEDYYKKFVKNINIFDRTYIQELYDKLSMKKEFQESLSQLAFNNEKEPFTNLILKQQNLMQQNTLLLQIAVDQYNQTLNCPKIFSNISDKLNILFKKISDQFIDDQIDFRQCTEKEKLECIFLYDCNLLLKQLDLPKNYQWKNCEEIFNGVQIKNKQITVSKNSGHNLFGPIITQTYQTQQDEVFFTQGYQMDLITEDNDIHKWWIYYSYINPSHRFYHKKQSSFKNKSYQKKKYQQDTGQSSSFSNAIAIAEKILLLKKQLEEKLQQQNQVKSSIQD